MKFKFNKKIIYLIFSIIFVLGFSRTVLAVWDGQPYNPGEVDNPGCLPSQINCDVLPAVTTELDPIFIASQAFSITGTNISNWDTAYSWGNHANAGYVTGTPWTSQGYITDGNTGWDNSYGFITGYTETDPTISAWAKALTKPSYTATDIGLENVTNESKATMFASPTLTGTINMAGNINMTGNIIPSVNDTYALGSPSKVWKDLFVGAGSIYVNGQKVLQTDPSNSVLVSADVSQNLILQTTGGGNVELNPASGGGQVLLKSNIVLTAGKTIRSSDLSSVIFSDGTTSGNMQIAGNIISSTNLNGGISITPNGLGNTYVTNGNFGVGTTSGLSKVSINGGLHVGGDSDAGDNNILADGTITGSNLSGTNTGDNATNSQYSGLITSKQEALNGTGFVKANGTTISYDNANYVTGTPWTGMGYVTGTPWASMGYVTGTPWTSQGYITDGNTGWDNSYGFITSYTETDPTFTASASAGITGGNISDWNTAFGWGNHASAGYLTSANIGGLIPYTGGTSNVDLGVHNLTVDTNTLFVNSANHRVGIGTTSPANTLDVNGNVGIVSANGRYLGFNGFTTGMTVDFRFGDSYNRVKNTYGGVMGIDSYHGVVISHSSNINDSTSPALTVITGSITKPAFVARGKVGQTSDIFQVQDSSSNLLLNLSSSGNVGIGITTPISKLDVIGSIKATQFNLHDGSAYIGGIGYEGGLLAFKGGASLITRMAMTWDGKVGIGTTVPTNILSLSGAAARTIWMERNTTAATAGQGLTLSSGGAIAGTADLAGGDLNLKSGISTGLGTSAMHFYTATAGLTGVADNTPTEKMTILGNGNVGIGTTNPTTKLELSGATANNGFKISNSDNRGYSIAFGSSLPAWVDTTSPNGRIDTNGNFVFNSGTSGDLYFNYDRRATRNNYFDGVNYFNHFDNTKNSIFEGDVGIGTTEPASLLHLYKSDVGNSFLTIQSTNTGVSTAGFSFMSSHSTLNFLQTNDNAAWNSVRYGLDTSHFESTGSGGIKFSALYGAPIKFSTGTIGGVEKMRLDTYGNLGIGTSTPTANLQVAQGTAGIGTVTTNGTTSLVGINTQFTNTFNIGDTITVSGETVRTIATITDDTHLTSTIAFTSSASSLTYTLVGGNRFAVKGNGNVGIGTINPIGKLQVDINTPGDGFRVVGSGVNSPQFSLYNGSAQFGAVGLALGSTHYSWLANANDVVLRATGSSSGNLILTTQNATGNIYLATGSNSANDSAKMTILNNGNIGIGTTSPSSQLTLEKADSSGLTDFLVNPAIKTSGNLMELKVGSSSKFRILFDGGLVSPYIYGALKNSSDWNNASISAETTGALISRNIADANPALTLYQSSPSSTGDILRLNNSTGTVVSFKQNGNVGIGTLTPTSEFQVNSLRTTGFAPFFQISAGKASGQAASVAFTRTNNTQQTLFAFETTNSSNPDGYFGTMPNKEDALYMLSGIGSGTAAIGLDSSLGLRIGTGSNIVSGSVGSSITPAGQAYFAGNVGIGTTNPSGSLSIIGASGQSSDLLNVSVYSGTYGNDRLKVTPSSGVTMWGRNGEDKYVFNDGSIKYIYNNESNPRYEIYSGWNNIDGASKLFSGLKNGSYNASGSFSIGGHSSNSFGIFVSDGTTYKSRLMIDLAGNVGIGTTNPTSLLTVNGNALFGTNVSLGSTTPLNVSFGGTYGTNTPGNVGNLKWTMYNDGNPVNSYGIGMSASLMEFRAGTGASLAFFPNNGIEAMRIVSGGNVGIGNTNPANKLDVDGIISSDLGFNITTVSAPTPAATLDLVADSNASHLSIGLYNYRITYTTAIGETGGAVLSSITTDASNRSVQISNIPISTNPKVTGRRIYRTKVNMTSDRGYLLTTIANNTATTFLDTIPDSSLTGDSWVGYKSNTTSKFISLNGVRSLVFDPSTTAVGTGAGGSFTSAGLSAFVGSYAGASITYGFSNTFLGASSGRMTTSGGSNIAIGGQTMYHNTTGSGNTVVGDGGLLGATNALANTAIGAGALSGISTSDMQFNVSVGHSSGGKLLNGTFNTFLGSYSASGYNSYLGWSVPQITNVNYSTAIGNSSYTSASYQTAIGGQGMQQAIITGDTYIKRTTSTGVEVLNNGNLTLGTSWSATNNCSLSSDTAVCTFVSGSASTLTQASTDFATAVKGGRWYVFKYTITGLTGYPSANITTGIANVSTPLYLSANGTHSIYFFSKTIPTDFVITTTLASGQAFTIDSLSLKEVNGGDLLVNGNVGIGTTNPTHLLSMGTGGGFYDESTGAWIDGSDLNYKDNILSLDKYGLSTLNKLRPVSYDFKHSGVAQIGFIAQEVKLLIPELVSGEEGSMGLNYGGFSPLIVKSIQDLDLKLEDIAAPFDEITNKTFAERFYLKLITWLGSNDNGLEKICVKKADGTSFCVNGDQLEKAVNGLSSGATLPVVEVKPAPVDPVVVVPPAPVIPPTPVVPPVVVPDPVVAPIVVPPVTPPIVIPEIKDIVPEPIPPVAPVTEEAAL